MTMLNAPGLSRPLRVRGSKSLSQILILRKKMITATVGTGWKLTTIKLFTVGRMRFQNSLLAQTYTQLCSNQMTPIIGRVSRPS